MLFLVGLTLLLVGFARPQRFVDDAKKGGPTIVLTLDTSGSMAAGDVRPTRLLAARQMLVRLLQELPPQYRIGLVTFADRVRVRVRPTFDRASVVAALPKEVTPLGGTSIGEAITQSLAVTVGAVGKSVPGDPYPPGAMVLVSDGDQTDVGTRPQDAAQLASSVGIPVHTVAIGTQAARSSSRCRATAAGRAARARPTRSRSRSSRTRCSRCRRLRRQVLRGHGHAAARPDARGRRLAHVARTQPARAERRHRRSRARLHRRRPRPLRPLVREGRVTRRRLAAAAALLALAASGVAAVALAGSPFYAVPPSPRKECHNVNHCVSVLGPWVVAPASGQASWLLVCPKRRGYVGGTDTRASSQSVRVWFEGQIGSPVKQSVTTGSFLLFHGVTSNGRPGSFQPTLGCIKLLHHTTGRSTVSARESGPLPGTNAGAPLDLYAKQVVLIAGTTQRKTATCAKGERLVGELDAARLRLAGPAAAPAASTRSGSGRSSTATRSRP